MTPEEDALPEVEYDDGYPVDEDFVGVTALSPKLSLSAGAEWLLRELPRAAEHMCCSCDVKLGKERLFGKSVARIHFSTGGWSGAESLMSLIERRVDLSYFMESWRRGGHYVFEVPIPAPVKRPLADVRAQAWATRRARYGESGHR